MSGKVRTPKERHGTTRTHTKLRGFCGQSPKFDSVRPNAGAFKTGFEDEIPQHLLIGEHSSGTRDLISLERGTVTLEMSGSPQALQQMIANMSHGGKIAILGIPAQVTPLDYRQVIFNMLTIKGIYGREMCETWYKMSVMLECGVNISPAITHRFAYSDFQRGFDAMISGEACKVVLDWTSLG